MLTTRRRPKINSEKKLICQKLRNPAKGWKLHEKIDILQKTEFCKKRLLKLTNIPNNVVFVCLNWRYYRKRASFILLTFYLFRVCFTYTGSMDEMEQTDITYIVKLAKNKTNMHWRDETDANFEVEWLSRNLVFSSWSENLLQLSAKYVENFWKIGFFLILWFSLISWYFLHFVIFPLFCDFSNILWFSHYSVIFLFKIPINFERLLRISFSQQNCSLLQNNIHR